MANLQAYFDVIYEIRGNLEDITKIGICLVWEEPLRIKENSDVIVRVSFQLLQETVVISQKLPMSRIIYEGGQYNLVLDGEYVAIGTYTEKDITQATGDIYYIQVAR